MINSKINLSYQGEKCWI